MPGNSPRLGYGLAGKGDEFQISHGIIQEGKTAHQGDQAGIGEPVAVVLKAQINRKPAQDAVGQEKDQDGAKNPFAQVEIKENNDHH